MERRIIRRFPIVEALPWKALWAGLLARLLAMPFAVHSDFIHMYWVSSCVAYGSRFRFGMQTVLFYLHAGYLRLVSSVLPTTSALCDRFPDLNLDPTSAWFSFVNSPDIYRVLFALKIPYLLFDLACAALLCRLGSDKSKSNLLLTLWWLNPLTIFAMYMFGRHETIAIFFVLLSLYLIKKEQHRWGMLSLGIAIAIRYYALFLLPFYALSLHPAWKKRLEAFAIGLAPWLVVNIISWGLLGQPEVMRLASYPNEVYLLPMKLQVAAWDNLYILPLLYFLLGLHRLYNQEHGIQPLQHYSLIVLLLLFATAYVGQSPHYWTWLLPFLVLQMAQDRRLLPLHAAQIVCLAVYSFIGSRATAGYLFASIAPDFFWSLPSPIEIISRFVSAEVVISLARTAFSAVALWMAYLVFHRTTVTFPADVYRSE